MKIIFTSLFLLIGIIGYSQPLLLGSPHTGSETYYNLQAGDTIHFYATFNQSFTQADKVFFQFNIDGTSFGFSQPIKEFVGNNPDFVGSNVIYRFVITLKQSDLDKLKTGLINFKTGLYYYSGNTLLTKNYTNQCTPFTITEKEPEEPLALTDPKTGKEYIYEYYDLQGHKIDNPISGVYLRVYGTKRDRVFIR